VPAKRWENIQCRTGKKGEPNDHALPGTGRRLERDGYIKGYTAQLRPELVDAGLLVFVEINLLRNSPDAFREFRRRATQLPELLECHLVSGNFDYLLKARVKDMHEYRSLLGEKILALPGVSDSRSYVVMEEVKETMSLPLFKA
jgi:Lrp/AsnC family leucine-responsive transcriptional regulator